MQEEFNIESSQEASNTLYKIAREAMKEYVRIYLELSKVSSGFANIQLDQIQTFEQKLILLSGIDSPLNPGEATANEVVQELLRMQAIPFDVESAITKGVYIKLRSQIEIFLNELDSFTKGFEQFNADYIQANPYMLPILQRLANITSKAALKKQIGSVSDNAISKTAAKKLADILNEQKPGQSMGRQQILQSIEPTLEGIVRDLVGRILLESIVAEALDDANVPYKLESQYKYIEGVIYNFRADFVIPDEVLPKAFIEVRKSSSRHASLYAKDKMFSAINWKGKNKDLLAVIVVDGEWTSETLKVMTKVFDYVVPLNRSPDVATAIYEYINGDRSKLKWQINFSISPAN
jgi:hypothetical protein